MLGSPRRKQVKPIEALNSAVARSFKGGLNTYDPALTMPSTYMTELRNMYPDANGALRVRFGTTTYASLTAGLTIVAMEYYIDNVVLIVDDGSIRLMDSDGATTTAATLWTEPVQFASFTQFGGNMIMCNGVDKPLLLEPDHSVGYLLDLGSGSNVNTPRAKFCTTHNNFVVMAGIALEPTKLYISSKGTSGTFYGDPIPNDGIVFDTSAYVTRGSPDITGIGSFRDRLIVTFDECILAIKLGDYDGTDHVPTVEDVIDNYGAVSHRTIVALGDDMLFLDKVGITSVQRALISATLSPTRESTMVSRDMQRALSNFSIAQLNNGVWAINDRIAQQILFFMPKEYDDASTLYTPTTLNPLDKDASVNLSGSDLICTMPTTAGKVRTVLGQSTGKWYFQMVTGNFSLAATNVNLGIAESGASTADLAGRLNCAVINSNFGNVYVENVVKGGSGTFGANALIEFAVDLDAKKIWVRPSITSGATLGIWNSSGLANPATGVGGYDISAITGTVMPCAYFTGGSNHTATYGFGPTYLGISGPPTGFSSWGTTTDIPSGPTSGADNDVYVLCLDRSQKFRAMTYYDQMPYRCGCRTSDGRIFVSNGPDVFYYRNQFEPQYLDFATEGFQTWSDGTPWTDLSGWTEPGAHGTFFGTEIPFAAATPWSDMKMPDKIKDGRYLHCVMEGDGAVTIKQYNDRFKDAQLSLDFNMTTYPETPDKIERPLNNDQLYAWNSRFTRAKLRVSGSTDKALSLLSIGLLYLAGGFRR